MEFSVYVKVDDVGRVVDINSSMFLHDPEGWIEIAKGVGDAFQHAQSNYMPKPIFNLNGIPIYKMEMGEIKERNEEEIQADVKPPEKSPLEKRIERIETVLNTVTELLAKLGMK